MKQIFYIITFIIFSNYSNAKTNIIYIDISNAISNKEEIITQTKLIVNKNIDDNFIVYITNDNNPIIIEKISELDKELNRLYYDISPSTPSIDDDIDSLNSLINKNNINIDTHKKIVFYFFSMPTNKSSILINKLLISNRFFNKDGLKMNITVNILLAKNMKTKETKKYINLYKQRGYEIKYY